MLLNQKLDCPHYLGTKVVKNGLKKSVRQNYRFTGCGKQFQDEYLYWGAEQKNKELVSRMLIRGSEIRDIANVLTISTGCVLRVLISYADLELKPRHRFYHQVQVDVLYSFVQNKKKKVWIIYAYCAQTKEILALTMGKRNKKTVKDLFKRLKHIDVNFCCTHAWKAFQEVFPAQNHLSGKWFTKSY